MIHCVATNSKDKVYYITRPKRNIARPSVYIAGEVVTRVAGKIRLEGLSCRWHMAAAHKAHAEGVNLRGCPSPEYWLKVLYVFHSSQAVGIFSPSL